MKEKYQTDDRDCSKDKAVAITGLGIVSSIGRDSKEFSESIYSGKCGIKLLQSKGSELLPVKLGAPVDDFSFDTELQKFIELDNDLVSKAKKCARRSPKSVQVSVLASLEAWYQAELHKSRVSGDRIGLVVAGSNISQSLQYGLHSKFVESPEYVTPSYALHFMDTDHVGTISEVLGIHGEGITVGGASASGNVAIIKGYQLVCMGLVDVCVVVGALTDLSPIELQAFHNLGAYGGKSFQSNPEKACRPFDRDHEGFIYGQAGGCIILESLESARKRNSTVIGQMLGGSIGLDGNRLSDPNEDGEVQVMEKAMNNAGITYQEIDYINTHGTSTPLGDVTELKAIKRVFKERSQQIWLNSTKGLTGHCLYSAGVVETIATIVQLQQGFIHPNLNLDNPIDTDCRLNGKTAQQADINMAVSNSFGFGGINTSIILKKGV